MEEAWTKDAQDERFKRGKASSLEEADSKCPRSIYIIGVGEFESRTST
jgi:hypothetical protein